MNSNLRTRLVAAASFVFVVGFVVGCSSSNQTSLPPAAANPDVVAVYAGEVLTLEEFETRYARAIGTREAAAADSLAEYEDFLERYVNFRLKVEAATDAGIPTSSDVQREITTYRGNLARPYLLEQEVIEPIIQQIYDRQGELIDVSHILVRVDPTAPPADTLRAYERLQAVRDSALQGVDFGDLALRHSEDPSATAREGGVGYRGRLGYFTAGRMVEPFETYAYETAEGEISPVFRTRFGYHILEVHDRREAVPDVRLAHIMLRPRATAADSAAKMEAARDLKKRIEDGAAFEDLASEFSDDVQSRGRGGDIGFISFDAPIHPSFKDPAFALEEPGDVSDVLETPYGYHIVKLLERRPRRSFDEAYDDLKQTASRLPRMREAEEDLAQDVLEQHGARVDTAYVMRAFSSVPADSVFPRLTQQRLLDDQLEHPVVTIGDSSFTFRDLSQYALTAQLPRSGDTEQRLLTVLDGFLTKAAIDFEAARLEERDAEFARIMDEFRDGLILFQFMEDSVWTAAEQDTMALQAYYDAHREDYRWSDRTRIISLQAKSDSLLNVLGRQLDAGTSVADVYAPYADDTLGTVRIDTMLVSESTNSVYDQALALSAGQHTEPLSYRNGYILLVNDGTDPARLKTFEEARTQVVSDYQTILEDRLIERLRRRYNAHTFPERLERAFASEAEQIGDMATGG